jgi:short-subunit dehydrogenase
MTYRWIITGATSPISEAFAHLVAKEKHPILLIGRNKEKLLSIKQNLNIRYDIPVTILLHDFSKNNIEPLLDNMKRIPSFLFLVHSLQKKNDALSIESITDMVKTNVESTLFMIFSYLQHNQSTKGIIFISSVAENRGRNKNSLYGATKRAVSLYLEGVQQTPLANTTITIAKLGIIDTPSTESISFKYKGDPTKTAISIYDAFKQEKRHLYYPRFWKIIMGIISALPFCLFKRLNS